MDNDKLLSNVSPEQEFHLANGRRLKNIHELVNALTSMDDTTFHHHVNYEKNDFANWIRGVFDDDALAKKIERTKNRKLTLKRVNKALHHQEPEPKPKKKPVKTRAPPLKPRQGKPKGFGVSKITKEVSKIKEVVEAKVKEHETLLGKDQRKKKLPIPSAIEQALQKKGKKDLPEELPKPKEGFIQEKQVEKKRWGYWGDPVVEKINKDASKKDEPSKKEEVQVEVPDVKKISKEGDTEKPEAVKMVEPTLEEFSLVEKLKKKDPLLEPLPTEEPILPPKKENPKDVVEDFVQREPTHHELNASHNEIRKKLDEVLARENEIKLREQKILDIEARLEQRLAGEKEGVFFSKEFVQGMVTGLLVTIILALVYMKFGPGI